jgi:hypothetical protein
MNTYKNGEEVTGIIPLIEKGLTVFDGYLNSGVHTTNGTVEPFISFNSCGVAHEGEHSSKYFFNQEEAINNFVLNVLNYKNSVLVEGYIYWRLKPIMIIYEFETDGGETAHVYNVRSRLLFSKDKHLPANW